jgi:hypothetical protein
MNDLNSIILEGIVVEKRTAYQLVNREITPQTFYTNVLQNQTPSDLYMETKQIEYLDILTRTKNGHRKNTFDC